MGSYKNNPLTWNIHLVTIVDYSFSETTVNILKNKWNSFGIRSYSRHTSNKDELLLSVNTNKLSSRSIFPIATSVLDVSYDSMLIRKPKHIDNCNIILDLASILTNWYWTD